MPKALSILWTSSAKRDLQEIIEYISTDSPTVAVDKLDLFVKTIKELTDFPQKGRLIPELEKNNIYTYRELIVKPWRIFYNSHS